MTNKISNHICPYCKEEIKADAIKCKHCRSKLAISKPSHDGVCPYCKEEIHKEANICKHCQSNLIADEIDCECVHNVDTPELPNISRQYVDNNFLDSAESLTELELFQSRYSSTLPKCHWRRRIISSPLPGYPPEYLWEYVCRLGDQETVVISKLLAKL